MVLSILSLTTTPSRIRFGISMLLRRGFLLEHGLDARDVATHSLDAGRVARLRTDHPVGLLEAQVERFLAKVAELRLELVGRLGAHVTGLHHAPPSLMRATNLVLIGSFAA